MSFQATAWASKVKTGSPASKAVLMMIANYMAPHEDEANGFLCGYPGQEIIADEAEMSVRSARDHIRGLVERGLLQKKMRFRHGGVRTSDWYRIPIKSDGSIHEFPATDDPSASKEWPLEVEISEHDNRQDSPPADLAGGEPASDHRQTVAGYKGEDQLDNYIKEKTSSFLPPQAANEESGDKSDPPSPKPEKPKKQRKGSRIPGDFTVTVEMVTWARENTPDVDGRYETSQFVDYWVGRSGSVAVKLDWVAAWRTWMRKAQKDFVSRKSNGFARGGHTPYRNPVDASAYQGAF